MSITKPFRFSYLNAKCRALKSNLADLDFFEQLIESKNIGDVYSFLQQRSFTKNIKEPNFISIESGLKKNFDELYFKITEKLSKKEQKVFSMFFYEKKHLIDKKLELENKQDINGFKKIDMEYIQSILDSLNALKKEDKKDLQKILGSYFDNLNLYSVFRLRIIYNAPSEDILPFLFSYGLNYNIKKFSSFLDFTTLDEFNNALKDIYKDEFTDIAEFRQSLYRYHYKILESLWRGFPFKISILFALLRMKEIENQNIISVLEGIRYNQPKSDMKRMIIGIT